MEGGEGERERRSREIAKRPLLLSTTTRTGGIAFFPDWISHNSQPRPAKEMRMGRLCVSSSSFFPFFPSAAHATELGYMWREEEEGTSSRVEKKFCTGGGVCSRTTTILWLASLTRECSKNGRNSGACQRERRVAKPKAKGPGHCFGRI